VDEKKKKNEDALGSVKPHSLRGAFKAVSSQRKGNKGKGTGPVTALIQNKGEKKRGLIAEGKKLEKKIKKDLTPKLGAKGNDIQRVPPRLLKVVLTRRRT